MTRGRAPRWCAAGWTTTRTRTGSGPAGRRPRPGWPGGSRRRGRRCPGWCCRTPRCARWRRCVPRSGWTGCGPTWSSRGPRWPTRRGRAGWRWTPRTSGPRPGSRCRTAAGASRSTRRSSMSSNSTTPSRPARPMTTTRSRRRGSGRRGRPRRSGRLRTPRRPGPGQLRRPHLRRPRRPPVRHRPPPTPPRTTSHDGPASQEHPAGHGGAAGDTGQDGTDGPAPAEPAAAPGATFRVRRLEVPGVGAGAEGRRSRARGSAGRVTGSRRPPGPVRQVHLTATLTAAAPYQVQRGRTGPGGLRLRREDLREARREGREGNLILFLVDASGSMAARARMGAVKGAVLSCCWTPTSAGTRWA